MKVKNLMNENVTLNSNVMTPTPATSDKLPTIVKEKMNEWYDWLVGHVPKPIK